MRKTKLIPMNLITPNRFQPRSQLGSAGIEELAASISQNGLIQPIIVREINQGYEIVAGERRFRACLYLGFSDILAIVDEVSDQKMAELALIENIQRENLSPIDEAKAYQQLIQLYDLTQEKIALQVGKSQSAVANKLRLLNLAPEIQEAIASRSITERHGRALLGLPIIKRPEVFNEILKNELNVKETEKLISNLKEKPQPVRPATTKGIVANHKIAVNTILQAVEMVRKVGFNVMIEETYQADETIMTIKIKK